MVLPEVPSSGSSTRSFHKVLPTGPSTRSFQRSLPQGPFLRSFHRVPSTRSFHWPLPGFHESLPQVPSTRSLPGFHESFPQVPYRLP
ncbi:hypothetical protein HanPI659440_Chr15g0598251 [Helianthus annuus]|nr:hypothetical protein HanPI659440_Chr15g0598251 [Helianthus annuus]